VSIPDINTNRETDKRLYILQSRGKLRYLTQSLRHSRVVHSAPVNMAGFASRPRAAITPVTSSKTVSAQQHKVINQW